MNAGPHLEFVGPVTEAFAFLTDRGFRAAVESPDVVQFERENSSVRIYHEVRSGEIDLEVRIGGEAYSMSELIRATDPVKAKGYRSWCATSADGIDAGLRSLARLLVEYGKPALSGDPTFLAALRRQRIEWSEMQERDTRASQDRVTLRIASRRASLGDSTATPSVPLGERWAVVLLGEPETGMGYHVATITLHDGRCLEDVTIVDGAITGLPPQVAERLTDAEIASITVTHGRRTRG